MADLLSVSLCFNLVLCQINVWYKLVLCQTFLNRATRICINRPSKPCLTNPLVEKGKVKIWGGPSFLLRISCPPSDTCPTTPSWRSTTLSWRRNTSSRSRWSRARRSDSTGQSGSLADTCGIWNQARNNSVRVGLGYIRIEIHLETNGNGIGQNFTL